MAKNLWVFFTYCKHSQEAELQDLLLSRTSKERGSPSQGRNVETRGEKKLTLDKYKTKNWTVFGRGGFLQAEMYHIAERKLGNRLITQYS